MCDLFNTFLNMGAVPKEELVAYGTHIKPWRYPNPPEYKVLTLPDSWRKLPAFPDAKIGLDFLRRNHIVVTLSNGPVDLQKDVCAYNGLEFDNYLDLSKRKVFKPHLDAYKTVFDYYDVEPANVVMVSANKNFGDIEAAESLGMRGCLIRHEKYPNVPSIGFFVSDKKLTIWCDEKEIIYNCSCGYLETFEVPNYLDGPPFAPNWNLILDEKGFYDLTPKTSYPMCPSCNNLFVEISYVRKN